MIGTSLWAVMNPVESESTISLVKTWNLLLQNATKYGDII